MMNTFKELPLHSKVWIYQSSRPFSVSEKALISYDANMFLNNWQSHGIQMNAGCEIFFNQFLVIALDESIAGASGCGIDKMVHFIKDLQQKLGVDFFNRLNICYTHATVSNIYMDENIEVHQIDFAKINTLQHAITTKIFNNTIVTKQELETIWLQPIQESWVSKHIQQSIHI